MIDISVIRLAQTGDKQACKTLHQKLHSKVFPICLRYSYDCDEAKDWCQDAFIKLYSNLHKYAERDASFEAWATSLFRNFCIDQYRRKTTHSFRKEKIISVEEISDIPYDEHDELEILEYQKLKVEQLLIIVQTKLTPLERTVFNMYAIDEYMHRQIAEILGININTIKCVYHRAKIKIREEMNIALKNLVD